jgi:acyl-CoA synthetase (NDP forming)
LLALDGDPGVGVLLLAVDLLRESWLNASYIAILHDLLGNIRKPFAVVANLTAGVDEAKADALRALGVPVLMGAETALRAVRHLVDYSAFQRRAARTAAGTLREGRKEREDVDYGNVQISNVRSDWLARLAAADHPMDEYHGLRLLADYGIPVEVSALATSHNDLLAIAQQLGYPLALKTASGVAHKSDVGGVLLGLADDEALAEAYAHLAAHGPRVLAQRMAPPGVELVLGIVNDTRFGLFLALGIGGVFVEVLRDTRLLKLPTDLETIEATLSSLRGAALLRGARVLAGGLRAVALAAQQLALLAEDLRDAVAAIDFNPLIAYADGVVAVDALVVPRGAAQWNHGV